MMNEDLYLPFERTFKKVVLRDKLWLVAPWCLLTSFSFSIGMFYSANSNWAELEHRYLLPILIGTTAIWGNLLFILRTTALARNNLPSAIKLLATQEDRDNSRSYLAKKVFNYRWLLVPALLTASLGELTFIWLGIILPAHHTTRVWFVIVIFIIFSLVGTTIGLGIGFWMWMWNFGKRKPSVDVFHPDKIGGLLPVADVSDWVISMGSFLTALYSLGAFCSPYAHANLRAYSYLWIAAALLLLSFAFVVPALSVHKCLTHARKMMAARLSRHNERLLAKFESDTLNRPADIMALIWFTESLSKLNVWPYRQVVARFSVSAALQFLPLLVSLVHYIRNHWHLV